MKNLLIGLLILPMFTFGQLKIEFLSVKVNEDKRVIAKVFVQNLSSEMVINTAFGSEFAVENYNSLNFYLSIENQEIDEIVKIIPSSIVIKTIFGTRLEMTRPAYKIQSTGSSTGEEWEIIFNPISNTSANVVLYVLGSKYKIGNMPKADDYAKNKYKKFMEEKDIGYFKYYDFDYNNFKDLEKEVSLAISEYLNLNQTLPYTKSEIEYRIDTLGKVEIIYPSSADELFKKIIRKHTENFPFMIASKYGYKIKSTAKFSFTIAKGKDKFKVNNTGQIVANPKTTKTIETLGEGKKMEKGKYKIIYSYAALNNKSINYSSVKIKKTNIHPIYFVYIGAGVAGLVLALDKEILESYRSLFK